MCPVESFKLMANVCGSHDVSIGVDQPLGPNLARCLCISIKFYQNITRPIHLHSVYGQF